MVRKINIESVYNDDIEDEAEIKNEVEEAIVEEVKEVEIEQEIEKEEEEVIEPLRSKAFSRSEEYVTPPKEINKNKTKGIDMPITKKTLEQVQCNACLKYMSEKNLRYSHPKYCLERSTIDTPSEIPIPNLKVKNDEAKQ